MDRPTAATSFYGRPVQLRGDGKYLCGCADYRCHPGIQGGFTHRRRGIRLRAGRCGERGHQERHQQLHGSGWEYLRNTAFDARNYFLPTTSPKASYHQNQFGGDLGGPVLIPKLYNGKNKTFFFGAYQGFRYSKTEDSDLLVPTAAELAGNESDNGQPQIYNPYATTVVGNGFSRPAFPGNQIPAALIDPRMVAYAKFVFPAAGPFFGTPNSSGAYPANAMDTTPTTQVQNEFDVRGDQNFGSKDSAWFRYSFINSTVNSIRRSSRSADTPSHRRAQLGRQLRPHFQPHADCAGAIFARARSWTTAQRSLPPRQRILSPPWDLLPASPAALPA